MTPPFRLAPHQVEKLQAEWMAGAHPLDLAVEYDVSGTTIYNRVKGLPNPNGGKAGRKPSFDHARASELVSKGYQVGAIAKRFGVSRQSIWRALRSQQGEGR